MRPPAWIVIGTLCACVFPVPATGADERVEGTVRETLVTHCDASRRGGCAGSLMLERQAGEKPAILMIRVPLGTPISRGPEHATLGSLKGQTVIVTHTVQGTERVARAIQVIKPLASSAVPDSPLCDVC